MQLLKFTIKTFLAILDRFDFLLVSLCKILSFFNFLISRPILDISELLFELQSVGDNKIIQLLIFHSKITFYKLNSFEFLFKIFDFSLHFKSKLLNILLSLLLELLELHIILYCGLLEILGLHVELSFQFMYFRTVKFLQSCKFVFKLFILNGKILILMQKIVYFEFRLGEGDFLSAKLIL